MIVFYSFGAGLGHICRTLDIIDQLNLSKPITILAESFLPYKDLASIFGLRLAGIGIEQPDKSVFQDRGLLASAHP